MKQIFLLFTILLFAANTNAQSSSKVNIQKTVNQKESIQVVVNTKGKVFINGKKTSLKKLEEQLTTLQEKNGVVHYFKSDIGKKTMMSHKKIMALITKYKRPIHFFTDKSFTTEIIW